MYVERVYNICAPINEVWDSIKSIDNFIDCIAYLKEARRISQSWYKVVARPDLYFLRSDVDMDLRITRLEQNYGRIVIDARVLGGTTRVNTELFAEEREDHTQLLLKASATFTGLLRIVPNSIMEHACERLADITFDNLRRRLE